MKHLLLTLALSTFSLTTIAGDKGNGGDILECRENGQTIYRTLDSVITKDEPFFERKDYASTDAAMTSILEHLGKTLPAMKIHLEEFLKTYKEKRNSAGDTFWVKTQLNQIADENLHMRIPEHCQQLPIQAVVLVTKGIKRYYYDPVQLDKIKNVDDELSWMLIHEFLRDYLQDADIIRIINSYIHSTDFLSDNDYEVATQLQSLSLRAYGPLYTNLQRDFEKARTIIKKYKVLENRIEEIRMQDHSKLNKRKRRKLIQELLSIYDATDFLHNVLYAARYSKEFEFAYPKAEKIEKQMWKLIKTLKRR